MFKMKKLKIGILAIATVLLIAAGIVVTMKTSASTPATSGTTVSSTAGTTVITWSGSIPPLTNATSDCTQLYDLPGADTHTTTINVPSGTYGAVNASYKFEITWTPVLDPSASDEIITVLNPDFSTLGSGDSSSTTETVTATNIPGGAYKIVSCGFVNAQPQPYTGKLTITTTLKATATPTPTPGGGGGGGGTFGGPDPTTPGSPRYQNYIPPAGSSAQSGSGEFNIGYNPKTGRIMAMNSGPIWRLTPGELQSPAKPECCEALWEDKSNPATNTGLDPILFTDSGYFSNAATPAYVQKTGRTFSSNLTAGANALYGYTDNDGELWTPIGAAPPGGADHQTLSSGPLPSMFSILTTPLNQGQYVLYCSQDLVGSLCQRSLDLGSSYTPSVPATGPGASNSQGCGGLHGHARIAPDGTAWLPDNSCSNGVQGGAISIDSSTTPWSEFVVKKTIGDANGPAFAATSQADGADPSVALDANSTAYYCYVNNQAGGNEGHAHVAVGKRIAGTTNIQWIRDTDVGLTHGIVNAAQTEAIGGAPGRAACGFLGTNVAGSNYQSGTFPGVWYAFIATTYDEGRTWVTVNATPNDPVQSKTGIWQQGGSGENGNRNLLDFNEITVDKEGRVLYGYSDGCVSAGCIAGTAGNDYVAHMRIARQTGGKNLLGDPAVAEPTAPKPACLSGLRDSATGSHLNWKIPDNGGSDIVNYRIKRSKTPGNEVLIGTTGNNIPKYDDISVAGDPTPHYYYVVEAINQNGTVIGSISNEVDLIVSASVSACILPGITVLDDTNADGSDADAGANTPPVPAVNIKRLSIGEPFLGAGLKKLIFTLNVAPSTTPPPPNSQWLIIWNAKNADADFDRRYVAMVTDATGAVSFDYGKFGVPLATTAPPPNPTSNAPSRLGAADSTSSYNPTTGVIKIVLDTSNAENIGVGETLGDLNVRTSFNRPDYPGFQRSQNNASDITGSGTYTLVGNASCAVQAPVGFESDVLGSTVLHTTDGLVDSTDVAQTRRYQIGFDLPYAAGEFQRADAAPLATFGDGTVDALDVAQARRYQAGLDPLQPVAGPTAPSSLAAPSFAEADSSAADASTRKGEVTRAGVLRVVSQKATAGATVTVALETDARGSESIYGFTLNYDAALLTYVPNSAAVGADAAGASVLTNATVPGQLGFSMDFAGRTIAAGQSRQLLTIQFKVADGIRGGTAALTFGDALARRSVASNPVAGTVRAVATSFIGGTVEISGSKPRLAGRVATSLNRSVAGAEVRLTDSRGRQLKTRTNSFGYYQFENLVEGESYTVEVAHLRLRFAARAVKIGSADEETNVTAAP